VRGPIWIISLPAFVLAVWYLGKELRRYQALRASTGSSSRKLLTVERWKYAGMAIVFGSTIPWSIALIRDAPVEVIRAILAVGGAGLLVILVASFVSGWMRG
jgi:hypothetical protein